MNIYNIIIMKYLFIHSFKYVLTSVIICPLKIHHANHGTKCERRTPLEYVVITKTCNPIQHDQKL